MFSVFFRFSACDLSLVFSADTRLVTTSGSVSLPGEVWTQSTRWMTVKKPVYCSLPDTEFAILLDDLQDKNLVSGFLESELRIGKFRFITSSLAIQIRSQSQQLGWEGGTL